VKKKSVSLWLIYEIDKKLPLKKKSAPKTTSVLKIQIKILTVESRPLTKREKKIEKKPANDY